MQRCAVSLTTSMCIIVCIMTIGIYAFSHVYRLALIRLVPWISASPPKKATHKYIKYSAATTSIHICISFGILCIYFVRHSIKITYWSMCRKKIFISNIVLYNLKNILDLKYEMFVFNTILTITSNSVALTLSYWLWIGYEL